MNEEAAIDAFLAGEVFAVAGASIQRHKYGNKCLRCYMQNDRRVYPINPSESEVEGLKAYANLASLPESVHGLSVITPPEVTEQIVEQAHALGIKHIWLQPGAESPAAISFCQENKLNLIAGGACLLVVLGYREL
tara:strand:- start:1199 stop:1603 length:405 start_codon:yes stop_codon:yes gene_type:complete